MHKPHFLKFGCFKGTLNIIWPYLVPRQEELVLYLYQRWEILNELLVFWLNKLRTPFPVL